MEIVENEQRAVESPSGAAVAENDIFSDVSLRAILEEFELLEIFEYD